RIALPSFPTRRSSDLLVLGATFMENTITENGITEQQMLTEKVAATWVVSYSIKPWNLNIDYTGNLYGPMRLPLAGDLDPRPPLSDRKSTRLNSSHVKI